MLKHGTTATSTSDTPRAAVQSYKLKMIDGVPENRHPTMLAKNPAGTTPFIELEDGTCLAESVTICEYLDLLYPNERQLTGGPDPLTQMQCSMWTTRVQIGITQPFQRQYQYGEGAPYFKHHVPWVEASVPALAGLRKQTIDNLRWLEEVMQDNADKGVDTGFIAGTAHCTVPDLQLYTTAKFMGHPKVNVARLTESFDPGGDGTFGPWLTEWYARMDNIVKEMEGQQGELG